MVYEEGMTKKTKNRRKYLIQGRDIMRITGLGWSSIQWHVWHSRFRWDKTGKIKKGKSKTALVPVKGKRYSQVAVWDVNDLLNYNPQLFRKLGLSSAWSRLRYDLNEFDD